MAAVLDEGQPRLDEGQIRAWLTNLYSETSGWINIVSTDNWAGQSFRDVDQAVQYIKLVDRRRPAGIYARATTLIAANASKVRGSLADTGQFVAFWADMDIAGPGHKTSKPLPPDVDTCLAILAETGLPEPTEIIHSGGGIYPWWLLSVPIDCTDSDRRALVAQWSADWQRLIELASAKLGYHYGAGVGDLTRVLRIPGTVNRKVDDAPVQAVWRTDLTMATLYTPTQLQMALYENLKRLEPPAPPRPVAPLPAAPAASTGVRPGDAFNAATTWPQLLEADGAQVFKDRGGYVEWTRPGKDRGGSATTGHKGSDVLKVFTDAWPGLRQNETYDRFGYYAWTRHGGNLNAAASALSAQGYGERTRSTATTTSAPDSFHWQPPTDTPADDTPAAASPAPPPPSPARTYSYTDSGYANRFQDTHGRDWRYVAARKQWMRYEGGIFVPDVKGTVTDLIDTMVQADYVAAGRDPETAEKQQRAVKPMLSSKNQLGATAVASRRRDIVVDVDQLDRHKHIVTCENGVLNLTTGEFAPHDRALLATKKLGTSYDPSATAPGWEKFLSEVLPNQEMRDYVQRAIGYTLTGETNRKAIFLVHSASPNTGKSQLLNIFGSIFGGFAASSPPDTFMQKPVSGGATPGLAKLRGARFVATSETPQGARLDEALIKRITGDEKIDSRALYQDEETWRPDFAVWFATNHLPVFNSDDAAIWKRVKPITFTQVFGAAGGPAEEFGIADRLLREEGPGILNWILAGLKAYRERGLDDPPVLKQAVVDYRNESDPVATFIKQKTEEGVLVAADDAEINGHTLYSQFLAWNAQEGNRYPLSANRFGRRMTSLGYEATRTAVSRGWRGLAVGSGYFHASGEPMRT